MGIKVVERKVKLTPTQKAVMGAPKSSEKKKKDYKSGGLMKNKPGKKGYADGGMVTKRGIMPTNQKTVQATGMGAATRGGNFKV